MTTPWKRVRSGLYKRLIGGILFTIEYSEESKLWYCRREQLMFDAARTLAEAKTYCVEG